MFTFYYSVIEEDVHWVYEILVRYYMGNALYSNVFTLFAMENLDYVLGYVYGGRISYEKVHHFIDVQQRDKSYCKRKFKMNCNTIPLNPHSQSRKTNVVHV